MSTRSPSPLPIAPHGADEVLNRVNALVPVLRARAPETEKLRRMQPDTLRDLTEAGVFLLAVPADVGGYEADDAIVIETLAQLSRGCPSTGWICSIITAANTLPALMSDGAADEIYGTPNLRTTGTFESNGGAQRVEGGYRITGRWRWNSGGVHSNWIAPACTTIDDGDPVLIQAIVPASEVKVQDNWRAAAGGDRDQHDVHGERLRSRIAHHRDEGSRGRRPSEAAVFGQPLLQPSMGHVPVGADRAGAAGHGPRSHGRVHGLPVCPRSHYLHQLDESG
jgi:alkylation response protein AidB-like acyl-CoA dehydrogenase